MPTVFLSGSAQVEGTATNDPNYLEWTISLSEAWTGPITVNYRFLPGTATTGSSNSGSDAYNYFSGTSVTFAAGETSKTVTYRIDADSVNETD